MDSNMTKPLYSNNTWPVMKISVKTQGLPRQNTVLNKPQHKKLNLKVKPLIKQFSALRKNQRNDNICALYQATRGEIKENTCINVISMLAVI